jgi:hypothetical protein
MECYLIVNENVFEKKIQKTAGTGLRNKVQVGFGSQSFRNVMAGTI